MVFQTAMKQKLEVEAIVEASRDTLRAMIHQEKRFYKCSNYLRVGELRMFQEEHEVEYVNEVNHAVPSPSDTNTRALPLDIIAEMAFESPPSLNSTSSKHRQELDCALSTPVVGLGTKKLFKKCTSPVSSMDNLYEVSESPKRRQTRRQMSLLEVSCLSSWRHQLFEWARSVCKLLHIGTSSSIVLAAAFNIFDRYLAIELSSSSPKIEEEYYDEDCVSKENFQLYCIVSLYIAIKTLIPTNQNKFTVRTILDLAQGCYSEKDIIYTERDILLALEWHVNPPTIMEYCTAYLQLLFPQQQQHHSHNNNNDYEDNSESSSGARQKCEYFADLAINDSFFLGKASSEVALAVVLLATDTSRCSSCRRDLQSGALNTFLKNLQGVVSIHGPEFDSILRRLECFW